MYLRIAELGLRRAPKRVLIYRTGSIGDIVVSLPALRVIAGAFPGARRHLLTSYLLNPKSSPASSILDHTGLIHGYLYYKLRTRSVTQLISLWWDILCWRADVLVDISPASGVSDAHRNRIFFRLCGISHIIGCPLTADMQESRPIEPHAQAGGAQLTLYEPEWKRLLRNISEIGPYNLDSPELWDLHLTPSECELATKLLTPLTLHRIIAVSIGTKRQTNEWGIANWKALLIRLELAFPQHELIVIGSADEHTQGELLLDTWRLGKTRLGHNLCGLLSPRSSAAALLAADVLICQDSGPMHLAAAVQTPCVAIFSSRNLPGVWFPHGQQHRVIYKDVDCKNCGLDVCIEQRKKCINSVSVEEVFVQVAAVLGEPVHAVVTGQETTHSACASRSQ